MPACMHVCVCACVCGKVVALSRGSRAYRCVQLERGSVCLGEGVPSETRGEMTRGQGGDAPADEGGQSNEQTEGRQADRCSLFYQKCHDEADHRRSWPSAICRGARHHSPEVVIVS